MKGGLGEGVAPLRRARGVSTAEPNLPGTKESESIQTPLPFGSLSSQARKGIVRLLPGIGRLKRLQESSYCDE